MALMRPDPTCYPSPGMAMQAPAERLAYVALLNAGKNGQRDAMGVIDLDPSSSEYGRLEQGRFHTLAGFVIEHMRRIPTVTNHFRWRDLRFEIVDMDGNRIDKVLVTRVAPKDSAA